MLDRAGDLEIEEDETAAVREFQLIVTAPGHELPRAATFGYSERFEHDRSLWRLTRYLYEYREDPPPGRLAYHWHDDSLHAHCVERGGTAADHHYRAHEVTLFEAHEEFARLYIRGERVRCESLRPALPSTLGTR